jgi:hypothetical protein
MQHERDPLGGSELFEHHEQCETDRFGQQRFVLCVDPVLAAHDRLGRMRAQGLLAPRLARAQHVQAHPRNDRRQPSAQVLDAARAGAAEPQPGFLDGVVRRAPRAIARCGPPEPTTQIVVNEYDADNPKGGFPTRNSEALPPEGYISSSSFGVPRRRDSVSTLSTD